MASNSSSSQNEDPLAVVTAGWRYVPEKDINNVLTEYHWLNSYELPSVRLAFKHDMAIIKFWNRKSYPFMHGPIK